MLPPPPHRSPVPSKPGSVEGNGVLNDKIAALARAKAAVAAAAAFEAACVAEVTDLEEAARVPEAHQYDAGQDEQFAASLLAQYQELQGRLAARKQFPETFAYPLPGAFASAMPIAPPGCRILLSSICNNSCFL